MADKIDSNPQHQATFSWTPGAIRTVRPKSLCETHAIVRAASAERKSIYPISRGHNWGLGSHQPPQDVDILMDLSSMTRIWDLDLDFGTVRVEAGVSFKALSEFLKKHAPDWLGPVTGGPMEGSVIGNAMERGDAIGPLCKRHQNFCNLQAVLADGRVFSTGFGAFPDAVCADLHPDGVGPSIDGLLVQNAGAIVTSATVWLTRRPGFGTIAVARMDTDQSRSDVVKAVRNLMQIGVIGVGEVSLWNQWKLLARSRRYSEDMRCSDHVPWYLSLQIGCHTLSDARLKAEQVESALKPHADDWTLEVGSSEVLPQLIPEPQNENCQSLYWRKPDTSNTSISPGDDDCGAHWVCVALPLSAKEVERWANDMSELVRRFGFEPNIGMIAPSPRIFHAYIAIIFDREDMDQEAKAFECQAEALAVSARQGIYPYRLGIQQMNMLNKADPVYAEIQQRLKAALDPQHILAPGRYSFGF